MDLVLRPVNATFLEEVVFPAFQVGVADAYPALTQLLERIDDERTRVLIETALHQGVEGTFYTLDTEIWMEAVYRLLFWEWIPSRRRGWTIASEYQGYAGGLDETLHAALMMEDAGYPYWDPKRAMKERTLYFGRPDSEKGLAALVSGRWHPFPSFPPDQALATRGRDPVFDRAEGVAIADWSYRNATTVMRWAETQLARLTDLLKREAVRLRAVGFAQEEIEEYWFGSQSTPPVLNVAFSGLGAEASQWVRHIGSLSRMIRSAVELEQGLTSIIVPPFRLQQPGDE